MKHITLTTTFFTAILLYATTGWAQPKTPVLWGLTANGGGGSGGTLFSINGDGTGFKKQTTFTTPYPGANPSGKLLQADNGKLYGLTPEGGEYNKGVLFSYDIITGKYEVLFDFKDASGYQPWGSLIQAYDSKLYGMASEGGEYGYGTIFSYDIYSRTLTNLFDFYSATGAKPSGDLLQAADSSLYGMTHDGGSSDLGVIFRYNIAAGTYTQLFNMRMNDPDTYETTSYRPYGSLVQNPTTKLLYGINNAGGDNGYGGVFSFNIKTGVYTTLYDFNQLSGSSYASPLLASNNKLYGTIGSGGDNGEGMIFELTLSNNFFRILKDPAGDFLYPMGNLVQGDNGMLYGLSEGLNGGHIFSVNTSTFKYNSLFRFYKSTGHSPRGSLIIANDGELYGYTSTGPQNFSGTLFRYNLLADTIQNLLVFNQSAATWPRGSLTTSGSGVFYGIAARGGSDTLANGSVFKYQAGDDSVQFIHRFTKPQGAFLSTAQLTLHSNGNLYGVGYHGGGIFSLTLPGGNFSEGFQFYNSFASGLTGSMLELGNGQLAGVHEWGQGTQGGIYSFDPVDNSCEQVKSFISPTGGYPIGGLLRDGNLLYGISRWYSKNGFGNIYSYDVSNGAYTSLYDFTFEIETPLYGGLVKTADGSIYGTSATSGFTNAGIIYKLEPDGTFSKVFDFSKGKGTNPVGTMLLGNDGKLYGMTGTGGVHDGGVVYSFDPTNNEYTKLLDLDSSTGMNPNGSLVQFGVVNGIKEEIAPVWSVYPNPAQQYVTILCTPEMAGHEAVIQDIQGRELQRTRLNSTLSKLDIHTLPSGAYIVSLQGLNANKLLIIE